jgi:transposase-like protein
MKRISTSEPASKAEGRDMISDLVKRGAQRIIEEMLEAEVREVLGRERYERGAVGRGYRNGVRRGHVETAEGRVEFAVPQVREVPGGFTSAAREQVTGRTEELERLAIEMYARGLSTRDIEEAFREQDGSLRISRTGVSEVTEALWTEYEAFSQRDLSDVALAYLFIDGVAQHLHGLHRREAVLVAWGIDDQGEKHLLSVAPGTKESTEAVLEFLRDMKRRGLRDPVLVATDGAPGLIAAVATAMPHALRQRCLAHRMRNIRDKLPDEAWTSFRTAAAGAYHAPSLLVANAARDELVADFESTYPAAVACFLDDFEACVAHLRCPPGHRKSIRTTNLLERLFEEDRRRLKTAPSMSGEKRILKLTFATMVRASARWRRISITDLERKQLEKLRIELTPAPVPNKVQPINSSPRVSSKRGT